MTVALGAACLLLAGLIVPPAVTTAQAGPSVQTRNGATPTTTYAVIRVIPVGTAPWGVAVDQDDDTVYVANSASGYVSVINGRTGQLVVATIPVGTYPTAVAIDQGDDTVYVANGGSNTVSVINGRTATAIPAISVGRAPAGVAVNQDDDTVYVTNYSDDSVSVINGRTATAAGTITVGVGPWGVAVDQSDDTVYVTNYDDSTVSVINGHTATVDKTIGVGSNPIGVAVNQKDDTVYVTNYDDSTVSVINGRAGVLTDDTIVVSGKPRGVAVDDTGVNQGLVYVTNWGAHAVSVIGRASPSLGASNGNAGDALTINVDVPQVTYDVDDSTVASVSFGGGTPITPSPLSGNAWQVTAPAGTPGASVAVTVTFRGGLTASAGTFTYAIPPPPVFPPSAPVSVTAAAGDARATLTWAAPSDSGSFPVTNYELRSTPAGGTCLTAALTCTITGLANGTPYTFEARALNGAGWGPWSTPSNTVTPTAPVVPSITITGSRGTGADRQTITVNGVSTGLTSTQVRAHVKLRGQADYQPGRLVDLGKDGSFSWQRTTSKKAYVYFTGDGIQSNRVIIPAVAG